jgi:hypothetical protein
MQSNLEDVKSAFLKASGASVGDESALVTHGCRFRGLYATAYATADIDAAPQMQLLDGSGGTAIITFNVTIPPTTYAIDVPVVSMMVPDACYVEFENGIYLKAVDDADGLNEIAYTVFYT